MRPLLVVIVVCLLGYSLALDNGLALTPPMGFNTWNYFACTTDCTASPNDCISEKLIMQIADAFIKFNLNDYGYEYINLDDCWLANSRDANDKLIPDPDRFPHGIKYVADYVHSLGLKFGIYEDCGTKTCEGFPGSEGHLDIDAQTYADWGVDFVKLDGCNYDAANMQEMYTNYSQALNKTGRPMVFSCSWPAYTTPDISPISKDGIGKICNLWRYYRDMKDFYYVWTDILNYTQEYRLDKYAGPGYWNDPDMLEVGNGGQTDTEYRSFFSLWAIVASPLILGNDIRSMTAETMAIVTNREVIAVNQDVCGIQGNRVFVNGNSSVWARPLLHGQYAVALFNAGDKEADITVRWRNVGSFDAVSHLRDLWLHRELGHFASSYTVSVEPHATVMLLATPVGGVAVGADDCPKV